MPETCKKLLGFVNSCVYYANQTHDIYQVLSYSVDFKGPEEIDWVRQYLIKVGLFRIKDLSKSEITAKLKSNLYVQPVDIFPIYDTAYANFMNRNCDCMPDNISAEATWCGRAW